MNSFVTGGVTFHLGCCTGCMAHDVVRCHVDRLLCRHCYVFVPAYQYLSEGMRLGIMGEYDRARDRLVGDVVGMLCEKDRVWVDSIS